MAILTSAFAALGSFHSEANPSLHGVKLYSSGTPEALKVMDKQIFRSVLYSVLRNRYHSTALTYAYLDLPDSSARRQPSQRE